MKNLLWWVIIAAYVIVILGIIFYAMKIYFIPRLRKKLLRYKKEKVQVPVLRIEYVPERISQIPHYRSLYSRVIPEEYNVHYVYGYRNHVFNNKELYDKISKGEKTFEIIVHKGYNKRGRLKHIYHTIA